LSVPADARYDRVATFYLSSNPEVTQDAVGAACLALAGPIEGMRVLDVACGGGRMTRALARRGAHPVGIDISRALLEHAEAAEATEPLGITYVHGDCTAAGALAGCTFDRAVCYFGLTDIDDLDGCLATVNRVLLPGATFTFAILHPCFPGWAGTHSASWRPGGGYFEEGWFAATAARSVLRRRVGASHRMLSTYLNALPRHGLVVERVAEPEMPADWVAEQPGADPVPVFLVVHSRRDAAAPA
jgi:ubiquinone/menaquinone biosynthesis C-methylase UbiE